MTMHNQSQEIFMERVREIIADTTGNDVADVLPGTQFEDELGVTPVDFKRIVAEINNEFEIELDPQTLLDEEVSTVRELTIIVREEAELG